MRISPAAHYTMGGLWVDYDLMSTLPGLFVIGEANFSDHGANRLGASAMMQGLADGYFILPGTLAGYLATERLPAVSERGAEVNDARAAVTARIGRLMALSGRRTANEFHRATRLVARGIKAHFSQQHQDVHRGVPPTVPRRAPPSPVGPL